MIRPVPRHDANAAPRSRASRVIGALLLACSLLAPAAHGADEQVPVPVGKGSYASAPPTRKDGKKDNVAELFARTIYVDPSTPPQPLPTNDWWTNLLWDRYAGNMWAYPTVVSFNENGVKILFPITWAADGKKMNEDAALLIGGLVDAPKVNPVSVLADFEDASYPSGWRVASGTAFDKTPSTGPLGNQSPVTGYLGKGFANSYHAKDGDKAVGVLASGSFPVDKDYIHFLFAGGKDAEKLKIELVVDNKPVLSATGKNSNKLEWNTWDVQAFKGRQATIKITDDSTAGWGHVMVDQVVLSSEAQPSRSAGGNTFSPADARALRWGDWTVTARLAQDKDRRYDVTFGRGLPMVWIESTGVAPTIALDESDVISDLKGQPLTNLSGQTALILESAGRRFGIFAGTGAVFEKKETTLTVKLDPAHSYLTIGLLPSVESAPLFAQYAFSIPRGSTFAWDYQPAKGVVDTTWTLQTEALEGTQTGALQGWLPHHYRETTNDLAFAPGLAYTTVRGKLKCATGSVFHIAWPFHGMVPMLPTPEVLAGKPNPYSKERLQGLIQAFIREKADKPSAPEEKRFGKDTYWGGKDVLIYGQYMCIADPMKDPSGPKLRDTLRDALVNWFTYTPGEDARYFARYPDKYSAMIGFNTSYGSEAFTDNHFHYGYFTLAAGLLGLVDPQFLKDYGDMAKLVAKQYANWDKTDTRFPFLRTFDPWGGHSYAGGSSSGNGNNQESSSEAMQSWYGLFILGAALNDPAIVATGAMGHAIEESAVLEYWYDYHGWKDGPEAANFSPAYGKTIVGIVGDSGNGYATFFNGEPMYIYGIQWLPVTPALYYLGRDPAFGKYQLDAMLADQAAKKPGFTFSKLGDDWGNLIIGYEQFNDPDAAAARLDDFLAAKDPIATGVPQAGIAYSMTHTNRMLGPVRQDAWTDLPTSMVFGAPGAAPTVVAWNPQAGQIEATLYIQGKASGTFKVPPHTLVWEKNFSPSAPAQP